MNVHFLKALFLEWVYNLVVIFFQERYPNNSVFNEVYGKNLTNNSKAELNPSMAPQETSLYSLFEGTPWSPSLPASSDHSTPASQSPHSSNPSSLPSSPPAHNHNSVPFSNFGPIGTPDNRDRRGVDRWKTDKPGEIQASLRSRNEITFSTFPWLLVFGVTEHVEFLSLYIL